MKPFEYFLKSDKVKRQKPDLNLHQGLVREAKERLEMAKRIINSEPPKFALENAYEAIREMADAYLYKDGFKSFSHEASIIYLEKLKMPASLVAKADWLRKRRIGIKYYGEDATMEEAQEAILIAEEMFKRLKG